MGARGLCPEKGGPAWVEVRSPHFLIRTDLNAEAAEKTARELERSRRGLTLAFGRNFDPKGVVEVYVVRNQFELDEFAEGQSVSGVAVKTSDGVLMVMKGEGYLVADAPSVGRLQIHELAHYLSGHVLLRQPRWLAEGLAQYLETMQLSGDERTVEIGRADKESFLYVMQHGRVDFSELWGWNRISVSREAQMQAYYATAWVWVHYLMNKQPQRFAKFQAGLARAEDPSRAWSAAFADISTEQMNAELNNYQRAGSYTVLSIPLPQENPKITVRPMQDAEVHVARARLHGLFRADAIKQVATELAEANRLDPTGLATVEIPQSNKPEAEVARIQKVLSVHPNSAAAWRALSQVYGGWDSAPNLAEKEAALRKAIAFNQDDASVFNSLAWFLVSLSRGADAISYAQRAAQLAPWSSPILDTYAAALEQTGKCAEATSAQKRAVDMLGENASGDTRDRYQQRLDEITAKCATSATR